MSDNRKYDYSKQSPLGFRVRPVIYLDMDGVLANFDKLCHKILGRSLSTYPDSQSGWDALAEHRYSMYLELEPMPDAFLLVREVLALAKEYDYEVAVLTAVPKYGRVPLAKVHKMMWLKRMFPELLENFNIGPWAEDKHKHCRLGDILIDDSDLNCPQWDAAGGTAILHVSAEQTIIALRNLLLQSE